MKITSATTTHAFRSPRLRFDHVMKFFFGGNAAISFVALALITFFLFREGIGFLPQNLKSLRVYRKAGLEYVDIIRVQVDAHTALSRYLQDLRQRELNALLKNHTPEEGNAMLTPFDSFAGAFDDTITDLRGLVSEITEIATAIKDKAKINEDAAAEREMLLAQGKSDAAAAVKVSQIDFAHEVKPITASFPACQQASLAMRGQIQALLAAPPQMSNGESQKRMQTFVKLTNEYLAGFPKTEDQLRHWDAEKPVPWYRSITSFLFGREWITNSFFQDYFGVLPLLVGSLLISGMALALAVPFGVCGAIYVSEVASAPEQHFIKPFIEFISAIPSVVLGFFGIAVLGEGLRWMSNLPAFNWLPFFPINERLNVFTAGSLLALMAVPTIFSLSEDALNNVPRALKEASYALGATRVQTIVRILVPSSLSGIISAVLLGFGRVIGETMVVLLCAGNRIAIPDFTERLGVIFQPVHTMTGIIAQEMGEVVKGSIHYRALFMIGILLFMISLCINWLAQTIVRRYRLSIG